MALVDTIEQRYQTNIPVITPVHRENFLVRQVRQLKTGGWAVLVKKVRRLIKLLPRLPEAVVGLLWAVPVVILVRLLRPWKRVCFGTLRSSRIGHFAIEPELYLCARQEGIFDSNTVDVFYYFSSISNRQLKKMWDRVLRVSWLAKWPDWLNRRIPGGNAHKIPLMFPRDVYGLTERVPSHLSFTAAEEERGRKKLNDMGLFDPNFLVCFHARDKAYLDAVKNSINPDWNWQYHDYRDSTIQNYVSAAEALADLGYTAIRTGHIVKDRIHTSHLRVIDYAVNGMRDDFMDIYLGAKCRFYICSAVGVCSIPKAFRRPIAFVNFVPLQDIWTWGRQDLSIMKKIWMKAERRLMTFREVHESGAGRMYFSQEYEKAGLEVVENSPEEITALALEMHHRLNGTWQTNEEWEDLQKRFWALFPRSELHGKEFLTRIGSEFLFQHRNLLV